MMRSFVALNVVCVLFFLVSFSAAWPWRPHGMILDPNDSLDKRADAAAPAPTTASGPAATPTNPNSGPITSASDASQKDQPTPTNKDTNTNGGHTTTTATGTGTNNHGAHGNSTAMTTSSIFIDPRLPPGGVSMIDPPPGYTTYYKVGNWVTFAWNYTSLVVTPTAVNVAAVCTSNAATWTLASNMSVQATGGSVLWDTRLNASGTVPLLTATYTLIIWDASKSISDIPSAGLMAAASSYFTMYVPQKPIALADYQCATCSGALSDIDRNALKFMGAMIAVTILSFTWFAGGVGAFAT